MSEKLTGSCDTDDLQKDKQEKLEETGVAGEDRRGVLKLYIILCLLKV